MGKDIIITTIKSKYDNRTLKPDDDGYYSVILGAVNAFNSAGEFYDADGVAELITSDSSRLYQSLKYGALKGEIGHPSLEPGMSKQAFYARNMKIKLHLTSHHIKELRIIETHRPSGVPGKGNYVIIKGKVKPSGPYGDALKKALDNPEENVSFSIRCFTINTYVNGVTIRKISQIITWDWVNEPGIDDASKWKTLGIEELAIDTRDICSINMDELSDGDNISDCFNCALETNDERSITRELIANVNKLDNKKSILDLL